jgi:hypothetical protein
MVSILELHCYCFISSTGTTRKRGLLSVRAWVPSPQVIGNNTEGTLIGAAGGALAGAIAGNAIDQNETEKRIDAAERKSASVQASAGQEQPPGEWDEIPGQWVNGKWIPAHRAWVPVNPGQSATR